MEKKEKKINAVELKDELLEKVSGGLLKPIHIERDEEQDNSGTKQPATGDDEQ